MYTTFHSQHSSDDESIGEDEYVPNEKKLKEITSIIEKVRASKAKNKRKKLVDPKTILEKENSHQPLVRIITFRVYKRVLPYNCTCSIFN